MSNWLKKLKHILRDTILFIIRVMQRTVTAVTRDKNVHLVSTNITQDQLAGIAKRMAFYAPGKTVKLHSNIPLSIFLGSRPILVFGSHFHFSSRLKYYHGGVLDIDHNTNPMAAWDWCLLAEHCANEKTNIYESYQRFVNHVAILKSHGLEKSYIFGTGPSLALAEKRDWSDGYRIVCNTIVRDRDLWNYINPHFIVAGDALYHFSYAEFARAFRKDLASRLSETGTFFVYPSCFHQIIRRELDGFLDRLIPIPISSYNHKNIHVDLCRHFELPLLGNVLPLLLLPLASTLSRQVFLWGFDGRAPNDQLFWANSTKHSYPELLSGLQEEFPAFFDTLVPKNNPSQYVKDVHGDVLDECMKIAEKQGWSYVMMHKSWTPTFQKRYKSLFGEN